MIQMVSYQTLVSPKRRLPIMVGMLMKEEIIFGTLRVLVLGILTRSFIREQIRWTRLLWQELQLKE